MTTTDTIAFWLGAALLVALTSMTGLISFSGLIHDGNELFASIHRLFNMPSGQHILSGLGHGVSSLSHTVTSGTQSLLQNMITNGQAS